MVLWLRLVCLRYLSVCIVHIVDVRYNRRSLLVITIILGTEDQRNFFIKYLTRWKKCVIRMVLILDGNSLRGAHVRRNICYSTCSRLFITSRAVTNRVFLTILLHACATCNELPSNISTMVIRGLIYKGPKPLFDHPHPCVNMHTECPKIYRKSVLHLLKYTTNLYLSRCSTDLR